MFHLLRVVCFNLPGTKTSSSRDEYNEDVEVLCKNLLAFQCILVTFLR